jgi:tRNA G18 (ribose-2'-O)-methylase SpoU
MPDPRVVVIDGVDDPRIAEYRDIADHDALVARGLFVAEGRLVVERLLDDRFHIRSLLLNRAAFTALEARLTNLPRETATFICATEDFEALTGYDIHRGCLALAERPDPRLLDDLLMRARSLVLLEGVGNADNIGGIFRNAAAFGADAVILDSDCCDPLYRKAIRVSVGAALTVPFARLTRGDDAVALLRSHGLATLALSPRGVAPLHALQPRDRVAVLLGAEGPGLPDVVLQQAETVAIRMAGEMDSLNVATASGIVLHHLAASRR